MEKDLTRVGISLGWNCNSAVWGVENGVRLKKEDGYKTCPFDIMVSNYPGICECIKDDFEFFYDEKYLELIYINENESALYNNKYNFVFNHESPGHANLYLIEEWPLGKDHFILNNYENLKKLYSNRIKNFREYLSDQNNFITFIETSWNKNDEDMQILTKILKEKYPNLKYRYIFLNNPLGPEHYIQHLVGMRIPNDNEELKRLL